VTIEMSRRAITAATVIAILLSWQGLEAFSEDGRLTVGDWFLALALAGVIAFGLALAHDRLFGRHTPDDE
jgi:hypothetical protein